MTDISIPAEPALQLDVSAGPDRQKSLVTIARNTAAMLSAQIVIKLFAFVFSVYVVRRLGAADFGRYSAAMAYAFIFAMLTELGTSTLSVREMARKAENITWMVPNIIALRTLLSLLVIAGVNVSAWLLGKTPDVVLGIFIASIGLLLYAVQGPLDSALIARERLDFSSVFNLLNQLTFMILGTILLLVGAGYIGLLLASLAGILVVGLLSAYVVRKVLKVSFERPAPRLWWSLLQASFPFGVIGIVVEFTQRFDVVFMSFVLTYAAVGLFNVSLDLPLGLMILAQSLGLAIFPAMVREYDSGRGSIQDTLQRALRYLLLLSLPIAVGGTLLADRLIVLLYGPSFAAAAPVMQIVVWGLPFMFLAEVLGRACTTMHLEKKAAVFFTLNALLGVVLSLALIPTFGVIGAAIAMVISRLASVIQSSMVLGPTMVFRGNVRLLLRVVAAAALMGVAVWFLRGAAFVTALDDKIALVLLIGVGAIVFGLASLLVRAISPGEARYINDIIQRRLHRLGQRSY